MNFQQKTWSSLGFKLGKCCWRRVSCLLNQPHTNHRVTLRRFHRQLNQQSLHSNQIKISNELGTQNDWIGPAMQSEMALILTHHSNQFFLALASNKLKLHLSRDCFQERLKATSPKIIPWCFSPANRRPPSHRFSTVLGKSTTGAIIQFGFYKWAIPGLFFIYVFSANI